MKPTTDLLERSRNNDRKAHHELYVMCFPVLYSVCSRYHVNKEDRMSSLNMIFVKLIQHMGDYLKRHSEVPFEQWMRRVSINYIIDEFRREKRYRDMINLGDAAMEGQHHAHSELESRYDKEEIMKAIESLPAMSRTVFNLYAVDGYKHEEIAGMLGISSGTSKAHLFHARKKLQEMLSQLKKKDLNKTVVQ